MGSEKLASREMVKKEEEMMGRMKGN